MVNIPLDSSIFAGRYHNLQYWFSDSIYIAGIQDFNDLIKRLIFKTGSIAAYQSQGNNY